MKRILIVDDDDLIREMLKIMLESENFEVEEASDGGEALNIHKQKPVDLLITDLIMPEKEGIETIREFKRFFPEIKIIAMSGGGIIGPEAYLKIAESLGADMTFVKPIERDEFLEGIKKCLSLN